MHFARRLPTGLSKKDLSFRFLEFSVISQVSPVSHLYREIWKLIKLFETAAQRASCSFSYACEVATRVSTILLLSETDEFLIAAVLLGVAIPKGSVYFARRASI